MKRHLYFTLAALCVAGAAVAQDDDRVVPAHEEPRHVPKFVNEWVRIIDVEIPEGERTLYHAHSLDYPYVMISSVTLHNQVYVNHLPYMPFPATWPRYLPKDMLAAFTLNTQIDPRWIILTFAP